jgi:hypothetical protein
MTRTHPVPGNELIVRRRRLHDGQERLKASQARFRVAMFGRRWGKNVVAIDEAMQLALAGKRVGWWEPSYKYLLEAWRDLCSRLRPVANRVSEQEKRLELITGGLIECWTADDPDAGRGREYDLAIINEAGIVRNLKTLWEGAIWATLIKTQGRALFLGTPKGRTHDFSVIYSKAATDSKNWEAFRGPTIENPHIPKEEIATARAELPPQIFAQEFEGIPSDDGGNPFGLDAIKACTVELGLAGGSPVAWGWDFARAQDWTVGIALDREYRVVGYDRWQLVPWGETKRKVAALNGPTPAWGDSTGIGDVIVEDLQRAGCPMIGVPFSRPMKQQLMERLAAAIQQRKVRFPKGPISIELETFEYEYTASGVRYSAPEGLHDDCVMALALAVFGRDQFGVMPVPETPFVEQGRHPGFDFENATRRNPWEPREKPYEPKYIPNKDLIRL